MMSVNIKTEECKIPIIPVTEEDYCKWMDEFGNLYTGIDEEHFLFIENSVENNVNEDSEKKTEESSYDMTEDCFVKEIAVGIDLDS